MYFRLLPSWRTTTTTIVVYRIRALETVLLAPSGMRRPSGDVIPAGAAAYGDVAV
jgi:hypothetical protein